MSLPAFFFLFSDLVFSFYLTFDVCASCFISSSKDPDIVMINLYLAGSNRVNKSRQDLPDGFHPSRKLKPTPVQKLFFFKFLSFVIAIEDFPSPAPRITIKPHT